MKIQVPPRIYSAVPRTNTLSVIFDIWEKARLSRHEHESTPISGLLRAPFLALQSLHSILAILLCIVPRFLGTLCYMVFLCFVSEIIDHVRTNAGPMHPVEEAPRCKVALPTALAVKVLSSGDAAEDDAGYARVA